MGVYLLLLSIAHMGIVKSNNDRQNAETHLIGRSPSTVGVAIHRKRAWVSLTTLLLVAAILLVYWPVRDFGFVDFDDHGYVTANVHVVTGLTWKNLHWAFTTSFKSNWHPLTWISHMADVQLFGLNPGAHHQTNVILHIVNTVLLLLLLSRMTGAPWKSAFVAALFALHPLHVESVAWISERKDLLSSCFGFLAIYAYIPWARKKSHFAYIVSLMCFALSLMAKPMLVTLPFLLLLFDVWPLERSSLNDSWSREKLRELIGLVVEKIPFFGLSALSSVITVLVQGWGGAIQTPDVYPTTVRVFNAIVAYIWYPIKTLWPRQLAVFYPHPGFGLDGVEIFGALVLLVGVSYLAVRYVRRCPYLFVGWFGYLGMLVPVIGIVQVGGQGMADRYSYVPLIGLFLIVAWGLPELLAGRRYRNVILWGGGIVVLAILSVISARQVEHWRDSKTLFHRALSATQENAVILYSLGSIYFLEGDLEKGEAYLRKALQLKPHFGLAHKNMGAVLAELGHKEAASFYYHQAVRQLRVAVENTPDQPNHRIDLARVLLDMGRAEEAEAHLRHALRYTSTPRDARLMLARSLLIQHRSQEAIDILALQLRHTPEDADSLGLLGEAFVKTNNAAAAVSVFERQLKLGESADARNNLGIALANAGRMKEAIQQLSEAVRLSPDNVVFRNNLEAVRRDMRQAPQ